MRKRRCARLLSISLLVLVGACGQAHIVRSTDAGDPASPDIDGGVTTTEDARTEDASAPTVDEDSSTDDPPLAAEPSIECVDLGCVRHAEHVDDYSREQLMPFLDPAVSIDNGYSVWTIRYLTENAEALATVTIPYGTRPPHDGFHIVGNNHGTTGLDDPCALTGTVYGTGLAGLFGARGMIGVAPDYPGLGTDGLHPYLVADVEGKAALDALRAAGNLARWLDVPTSGRFATVGLSQGGHATLAAAALHRAYAPELDIRAFSAAAPAAVWFEHWRSGVSIDGTHIALHAMMVHAWMTHYGYEGPDVWADEVRGHIDTTLRAQCAATLSSVLGTRRDRIFNAEFLHAYSTGEWGEFEGFADWFEANRIDPYDQTARLRIYQGDVDAVVLPWMTDQLVEALREGGVDVEYEIVPGGTHLNVAWGFVASNELRTDESIAWLREQLDAGGDD